MQVSPDLSLLLRSAFTGSPLPGRAWGYPPHTPGRSMTCTYGKKQWHGATMQVSPAPLAPASLGLHRVSVISLPFKNKKGLQEFCFCKISAILPEVFQE